MAVVFSGLALAPATRQAIDAHRLTEMVEAADSARGLIHRLQHERAAATALVTDQSDAVAFRKAAEATDTGVARFREQRAELSAVPENARAALDRIAGSLAELASLRAQALSGSSTSSALAFRYRIVIADLISYREGIAQADGVAADVADRIRAAASLSRAAEHVGRQQVTVMKALAGGGFTPASQRTFDATVLGYGESVRLMFDLGPPEWRALLQRTLAGSKALEARHLEDRVGRTAPHRPLDFSAQRWRKVTSGRLELLWSVERRVDESLLATVEGARTRLALWAGGEVLVVVSTLVAALVFASRLGRVMLHRLRDLRNAAHDVAHHGLPRVMSELARPDALTGTTPEQVAERADSPVRTTGRDEIGEVGEAFNAVHHEAVRLAAQRAHAHAKFAETLVAVARRGAQLTSVMVSELDEVQRDESDPQRMKVLFALDHLAVRMERNTNSLLVLGGHGQARVRAADAPCSSVIVAAAQQIERFERVSIGVVEDGIHIAARAVHDLAHLLAELLDNATRFSPPDTEVGVTAWRLTDRAVLAVVDEGIGIPPERRATLNAQLAQPRTDVGGVRSMGLHVVGQLAARYGITVELRGSSGPGTIAEVTLPASVLTDGQQRSGTARGGAPGRRPRPVGGRDASRSAGPREQSEPRRVSPSAAERAAREDPAARVAGVSASGLPIRRRAAGGPGASPGESGRGSTPAPTPAAAAAPRRPAGRRDSREISDVFTAYAQGISRSTSRRRPPGTTGPRTTDTTQRST